MKEAARWVATWLTWFLQIPVDQVIDLVTGDAHNPKKKKKKKPKNYREKKKNDLRSGATGGATGGTTGGTAGGVTVAQLWQGYCPNLVQSISSIEF